MIRCAGSSHVADKTVHGSNVDDATVVCLEHLLAELSCADKASEEVNLHFVLELLVGDFRSRCNRAGTCVVDENVDASEFRNRCCNRTLHSLGVGDVAGVSENLYAVLLLNLRLVLIEEILAACHKHEICSLACERLGHLHSEARGSSGDNSYLTGKIKQILHIICPFVTVFPVTYHIYYNRWKSVKSTAIPHKKKALPKAFFVFLLLLPVSPLKRNPYAFGFICSRT